MRRLRREELQEYAVKLRFSLDESELDEYLILCNRMFDVLQQLANLPPEEVTNLTAKRDPGRRPTADEDPFNAIIRWCSVRGDCEGILSGKRIGVKDIYSIAGVPMSLGSSVMDGYVPEADSVVVERLIAAGAEISAVCNMDSFAFSGAGESSDFGVITNPVAPGRSVGGSSGGCAAALHLPNIDITFGGDQGGSVRLPAAWCGVLGLKPTHGLVPYTGVVGIDQTIDHAGPMARNTRDMALALEAVAGAHDSDPRQRHGLNGGGYISAVDSAPDDLRGTRFGLVAEGFREDLGVEPETADATREAVDRLSALGGEVVELSIPEYARGVPISFALFLEGATALYSGFGNGYHWAGRYSPDLALALGKSVTSFGDGLPPAYKAVLLTGLYLREYYFSQFYAKAQNLRHALRRRIDSSLQGVDFLIMPTATVRPIELTPNPSLSEKVLRGWANLGNTTVFNVTGHPSLSMPAALSDGLPVGVMITGRALDEARMLSVARVYEASYGWLPVG